MTSFNFILSRFLRLTKMQDMGIGLVKGAMSRDIAVLGEC